MTEAELERPKRNWLGLVITTLLGIAATVGVGWYQLIQAEKQATLAEDERARSVRQGLVSIVEEHILNDKPIDLARLARLTDQRRREERLSGPISVSDLVEKAELNILGSRYLAFERKQALNVVFDRLYGDLSTRSFAPYSSTVPNADLLNAVARQIQDGKSSEALQTLKRLQDAYARDLTEARNKTSRRPSLSEALSLLVDEPAFLIGVILAYVFAASVVASRTLYPTFLQLLRIRLGGRRRLLPSEARARIARYRQQHVPDYEILERLTQAGFPRGWARKELHRERAETAGQAETS